MFWSKQKEKIIRSLDAILEDREPDTEEFKKYFASMIKPKSFTGRDNTELKYDTNFEKNCVILGQYYNKPVKESTTREYFTLLDYYNSLLKQQQRGRATNKAR